MHKLILYPDDVTFSKLRSCRRPRATVTIEVTACCLDFCDKYTMPTHLNTLPLSATNYSKTFSAFQFSSVISDTSDDPRDQEQIDAVKALPRESKLSRLGLYNASSHKTVWGQADLCMAHVLRIIVLNSFYSVEAFCYNVKNTYVIPRVWCLVENA